MAVNKPRDIYGYRARIGYTSPPAATEVFPYEFYKMVPAGVTLVVTTLAIVDMSKAEIDRSYEISLRAAHELARAEVDLIVLGGRPVNRARGNNVGGLIEDVDRSIKVPITTSTEAQMHALRTIGGKTIVMAHPFPDSQNEMMQTGLSEHGIQVAAVKGAGYPSHHLGLVPRSVAMSLARELLKQVPHADTIWMPCPHWAVVESIDPIEKEFGVNVVTSHQAITWSALRRCKVNDKISGFGKLLREF